MQNMAQNNISASKLGSISLSGVNRNGNGIFVSNNSQITMPDNFIFEQVDPSQDDDDSDSDTTTASLSQVNQGQPYQHLSSNGLKPGKKTKGRVKIKMEFIQNKLRRYTTFSKRKTGIMKKAYELSTLTGTQVMLLVASETGHVYTFATRKLQPMITSESGKALIQTCLNSPDPPPGSTTGNVLEQRMKPTGFEETELTCGAEDQKTLDSSFTLKTVFPEPTPISATQVHEQNSFSLPRQDVIPVNHVTPISQTPSYALQVAAAAVAAQSAKEHTLISNTSKSISVKPNSAITSLSSMMPSTAAGLQPMQLIFPQGAISMFQPTTQQSVCQAITMSQSTQSQGVLKPPALSQVVSAINSQIMSSSQNNQTGELNTPLPAGTPSAINTMLGMTPGIVMYHTPQGVVYATPTQNMQERTIFNFPQPASALSMSQSDQQTVGQNQQHQIITIPVPVSLSGTPLLLSSSSMESGQGESKQIQPPPIKKHKK